MKLGQNGTLSSISIDCWKRRPEFTNDETLQPLKDTEQLIHNDQSYQLFRYERIYREQIKIETDSIIEVMISPMENYISKFLQNPIQN